MQFLTSIALLVSTGTLALAQNISYTASNCSTFSWDRQPSYLISDTNSVRASAAQTCPSRNNASHACPIEVNGDLDAAFKSNITNTLRDYVYNTPGGSSSYYLDLLNKTVLMNTNTSTGYPFRAYVVGNINTIMEQAPGSSGYLTFTRLYQCYAGTLSGCLANTLPDGTAVELCSPVYHTTSLTTGGSGVTILDGTFGYQEVSADSVSQYGNPFAGLSRGGGPSGAGSSIGVNGALLAAVGAIMATMSML